MWPLWACSHEMGWRGIQAMTLGSICHAQCWTVAWQVQSPRGVPGGLSGILEASHGLATQLSFGHVSLGKSK
jgi:hypothetical protein